MKTTEGKDIKKPKNLRGSVNDVLAIRECLQNTVGMDLENIKLLLAPADRTESDYPLPSTSEYKEPTYKNMVDALVDMASRARKGDLVYIHYSGHAGQATTIFPNSKGDKTPPYDQCLMPTDIMGKTGRYLRDVEFGALLQDIAATGAVVTVVLDCCHSGGAIRGDDDTDDKLANVRGTEQVYQSESDEFKNMAPKSVASVKRWSHKHLWMEAPKELVVLSACLDYQKAQESLQRVDRRDGKGEEYQELWHGQLTYWLLDTLRGCGLEVDSTAIYNRVHAKVLNAIGDQTPYLQGEMDRFFFNPKCRARVYALPVMSVKKDKQEIELGGGGFHGVYQGAEYAVLLPDFELNKPIRSKDILAQVRIRDVRSGTSTADIIGDNSLSKELGDRCQAVLQSLPLEQQAAVRFDSEDEQQRRLFERCWDKAARNRKLVRLLKNGQTDPDPKFTVAVKDNNYHITDRRQLEQTNAVLASLGPPLGASPSESMDRLVRRLEHIARYHMLWGLENHGCRAESIDSLADIDIEASPKSVTCKEKDLHLADDTKPGKDKVYEIQERHLFRITITNKGDTPLCCTILNFTPEFGINIVYPINESALHTTLPESSSGTGRKSESSSGGKSSISEDFWLSFPSGLQNTGIEKTVELFKVLVTRPGLDVGSLRLEKLGDFEKRYSNRGDTPGQEDASMSPLEELLSGLMPLTRDGHSVSGHKGRGRVDWQVKDFRIRVGRSVTGRGDEERAMQG